MEVRPNESSQYRIVEIPRSICGADDDHVVGLGERVAVRAVVGELSLAVVGVELAERLGAAEHVEDFGGIGDRRADGAAKTDLVGFCNLGRRVPKT